MGLQQLGGQRASRRESLPGVEWHEGASPTGSNRNKEAWVPWSGPEGADLTVQLSAVLRLCVFHDSIWWGQNKGVPSLAKIP